MEQQRQPILSVNKVCKNFPGVRALDHVDFCVYPGEVHALIGENGAGKSTLMKIILGSYSMTSGSMLFKGEPYAPASPHEALQKGVSMIHQEISLIPTFTVTDNIWIGREDRFSKMKGIYHRTAQRAAAQQILDQLGLNISADAEVSRLSVAEMQMVEIARAVSYDSDIVIMDEPTSALTNDEIDKLYEIITDLKKRGKIKIPLGDLKKINEGVIIDVSSIYNNKISLKVEEKLIAEGELVIVNDRYGVKVTKVTADQYKNSDSVEGMVNMVTQAGANVSIAQNSPVQSNGEAPQQAAGGDGADEFDYSDFDMDE